MVRETLLLLFTCKVEDRVHTLAVPVLQVRSVVPVTSGPRPEGVWFPWGGETAWAQHWIVGHNAWAMPALAVLEVKAYTRSALRPVPRFLTPWAQRCAVAGFVQEGDQWLPLIDPRLRPQPQ